MAEERWDKKNTTEVEMAKKAKEESPVDVKVDVNQAPPTGNEDLAATPKEETRPTYNAPNTHKDVGDIAQRRALQLCDLLDAAKPDASDGYFERIAGAFDHLCEVYRDSRSEIVRAHLDAGDFKGAAAHVKIQVEFLKAGQPTPRHPRRTRGNGNAR